MSKKRLIWGVSVLVLLLAAPLTAYWFAPSLLTIDSGECRADAIVVLGGDPHGRPIRAAELLKAGAASRIIVSGDGDCHEVVRALKQNGVPGDVIALECESRNTKENAEFTVRMLKEGSSKVGTFEGEKVGDGLAASGPSDLRTFAPSHLSTSAEPFDSQPSTLNSQPTSAIIVTSWYHSRRALRCFEKAAPDMRFYSRPSYYGLARSDWSRTGVSSHIRAEYAKIAGYAVMYGVWPF